MGRQLYRVPLDFDWPLDKIWKGYLRSCGDPDCEREDCPECARIDPPPGPGYQLWETTTEGSPQSPVFGTLDALCMWCEAYATTFADWKTSAAEWKRMLDDGFVYHEVEREGGGRVMFT